MTRVAFATLGCKVNVYESNAIGQAFAARDYCVVPLGEPADVYVVNSCTVTGRSDHKSRQLVRKILKQAPEARVIVTGCYAERDAESLAAIPGVHLVVGNHLKLSLPELLEQVPEAGILRGGEDSDPFPSEPLTRFGEYTRAFLKIQDGCDYNCSFCAVKPVRGKSRSLSRARVLEHAAALAGAGHREICLTGVDPGAWGRDLEGRPTLAQLIEDLAGLPRLERIRLSSVGAQDYDDHLIELVAEHEKLAKHVHIPVQSGSDAVLRRMKRGSNRAAIARVVAGLYARDASLRFGGDFMVGFPGESKAEFAQTLALVKEGPWSYGHVFPFSPRPGTAAAAMTDTLSDQERTDRAGLLRELLREKDLDYRRALVGGRSDLLIENRQDPESGGSLGLSSRYVQFVCDDQRRNAGQLATVRVLAVEGDRTLARVEAVHHSASNPHG